MARDVVQMAETLADTSVSVAKATAAATTIAVANGATVPGFFAVKDSSGFVVVDASAAGNVVFKAGDAYPSQNILGDLSVAVTAGLNVLQVERHGRFENKDGSLNIDFVGAIAGKIYAFGKHAGLAPVDHQ